jgi:hypothetical protein
MKNTIQIILVIISIIPFHLSTAQESKSSLVFGVKGTNFQRTGEKSDINGFYNDLFDPGMEVLYQYGLSDKLYLSSGLMYQYARLANWKGSRDRFRFGEISIPVIAKLKLTNNEAWYPYGSIGLSYGKMIHPIWGSPNKGTGWDDNPAKYFEYYSGKGFFADFLLSFGTNFRLADQNEFSVTPFIKYRFKDNWMGYFMKDFFWGINLNYQLNFKL